MKFKIRRMREADHKAVCSLHKKTFAMIGQTEEELLPSLVTHPTWVATVKDKVIGYVQVRRQDKIVFCTWFGVAKSAQGHGVGKALINRIIAYSKGENAISIQLETRNRFRSAICLYLNKNFSIVSTRLGPDKDTMIKMELVIRRFPKN